MLDLCHYFDLRQQFGAPVFTNLYFNNIGFYKYKYSLNVIDYNCKHTHEFKNLIRHPLIFWNVELKFNSTHTIFVDYITNTTTHPTKNLSFLSYGNKFFVHNPSLVLNKGFFTLYFDFKVSKLNFDEEMQIIRESTYKNDLLHFLNKDSYNNKIITLQDNNNGCIPKIVGFIN